MLTRFERLILDKIAQEETEQITAERICRQADSFGGGIVCSMVTIDRAGQMHAFAGPQLPDSYAAALDGIPIGPEVGSCGSAAFLRTPVAVTDIFSDARWAPYRRIAEPLGVRACWSSPILGGKERVLGAFGLYYREARGPTRQEARLVTSCTSLAAILLERLERRLELKALRTRDPLSGLESRSGFERALQRASRGTGPLGLLLVDIDGLRRVNQAFDFQTGDALIQEVGQRLRRAAPRARTFRLSGGEFAILSDAPDPDHELSLIARRSSAAMRHPAWCNGHLLSPVVTCGGATLPPDRLRDPAMLWWQAGLALGQAKQTSPGGFTPFTDALASAATQRTQAARAVTGALAEDRVEAHYQPIVHLGTRAVVGLEALCRIRTVDGGLAPATQLAEVTRAATTAAQVTERMLALVARDIRAWLDRGIRVQHVGVNLSMADFRRRDLPERIVATLQLHRVPPGCVVLEVTETVDLEEGDRTVVDAIERLRAAGLRVALDDFGTGYASLSHLLDVPVDMVKTDRSLMAQFSPGGTGRAVLDGVLTMAKGMGIQLIVEGVETSAQAARLERMGCEHAQGFLFGHAMPAAAVAALLSEAATGARPV